MGDRLQIAAKLLTRGAPRIAVNIAKLPELSLTPSARQLALHPGHLFNLT
jgi:hypothetical protein